MKNLNLCSVLLLFIFIASCKGQKKIDEPREKITQSKTSIPQEVKDNLADSDPYFIESEAITSAYGPTSITRNMIQDRKGNIWLACWKGIIRYDGKTFTNFTNKEGLRRFRVFSILEDRTGAIWFGTIGAGVYHYDGASFTNFTTKEGLANDKIGCIYEDKAGKIWFGTMGGVSCYDGSSFRNFTTNEGLCNDDINAIIEDEDGKFWFGTRGEACFYDGKTFTNLKNDAGAPFINVRSVIKDRKGNIWLGGNNGLWSYDGSSFTNYTRDFVGYIYEDKNGNIWTSSEASAGSWVLSCHDEKALEDKQLRLAPVTSLLSSGTEKVLYDEMIKSTQILEAEGMFFGILEDREGHIWFGTLEGVGRYNPAAVIEGETAFNYFRK